MASFVFAVLTPLCHFATSPPQGVRSGARGQPQPIAHLEGEMLDGAEGGKTLHTTGPHL